MPELPETTLRTLRELARAVFRHRREGGTLDSLPAAQREMLQAMDAPRREAFMAELAAAEAAAGREGLRAVLRRWQASQTTPDVEGLS
jgi:hypothetical protein